MQIKLRILLFRFFYRYNLIYRVIKKATKQLTKEQRKILSVEVGSSTLNLSDQVFQQILDHRYPLVFVFRELRETFKGYADEIINKYKFLFSSDLDPQQIRNIFLREMISTFTVDTRYFLSLKKQSKWYISKPDRFDEVANIFRQWEKMYSHFHKEIISIGSSINPLHSPFQTFDFYLLWVTNVSVSFPTVQIPWLFSTLLSKELVKDHKWFDELLPRIHILLASLSSCEEIYSRKYKVKIMKEIRHFLWSELGIKPKRSFGLWKSEYYR